MEMTAVWKERKSKKPFPSLPTLPWKARKQPRASHIPTASATTWDFLFLQARLTSTSTKSVTYMPGTFCYRHARSHTARLMRALAPEVSFSRPAQSFSASCLVGP